MTTRYLLLAAWDFDPSVVIGCVLLVCVYFWRMRLHAVSTAKRASYVCGVGFLFLALESPIDTLGDHYLFSAHMLQHLLLILIVPPLLLYGIPRWEAERWLNVPKIAAAEKILGRPSIAWWSCILVMTLWHLPSFYNAALANEGLHVVQHLSFLITGTMFWWPILSPIPSRRLDTFPAIFYLFGAAAENTLLGIIITFMPVGYYPAYLHPVDEIGALDLIRKGWGLTAAIDQRIGGLLMWIPGCSVYFVGILFELLYWFSQPDPAPAIEAHITGVA